MTYAEAVSYLDGFVNLERSALDQSARAVITLDSVRELARRLGDPQKRFASIHVAGTKGKGSTCAFAASMLRAQGLRVGLYVSPHLEDLRERITINEERIPREDFARIMSACRPVLDELRNPPVGQRRPTYFEILTHLAFTWFSEQKLDAAVIEVGLGGRLDATNIIEPLVCGIANISYDHTAILGGTPDLIAREKAGILKHGIPAVFAPQWPEVMRTLKECAANVGAPAEFVGEQIRFAKVDTSSTEEWPLPRAWARMPDGAEFNATLGLRGAHQIENWALALRLVDLFLIKRGAERISREAVERGSREVEWPGRLEWLSTARGAPLFLDGAHNTLSVEAVLNELRGNLKSRAPLVCLFACARDKDTSGMLSELARPALGAHEVIFTDSGSPRSCAPDELAAAWKALTGRDALVRASSAEGLALATEMAGEKGIVLVTGSLYLAGAVRKQLHPKGAA
ncbi:MAG TPA: folylpolyglutamate synthase/dihydrofolate synthase family protein [Planctomycetota bacterium]|nr:folylpolyglutamate synthase/dihydrofolate synthase family protein [Planctomycetota bacterium]